MQSIVGLLGLSRPKADEGRIIAKLLCPFGGKELSYASSGVIFNAPKGAL